MKAHFTLALVLVLAHSLTLPASRADYDPLRIAKAKIEPLDLVVKDGKRSREVPVRAYLPKENRPAPVVLFSHGLGGTRQGNRFLGEHWAARGYVAVFLQHPGSDDGVWKGLPAGRRMAALKKAASGENFRLRAGDVTAVLDRLGAWNKDRGHALAGRLDLGRVGMSGHSFGAVTTQAVSGQRFPLGVSLTDARVKAAVLMSPSPPRVGDVKRAFGAVKLPWLLLTGTRDDSPIGDADAKARQAVFPALPAGSKYELVLDGAEHSAFTDRALPGDRGKRNPNHHKAVLAVTTAFWDAYLRDDAGARKWLDGEGAKGALEKGDRWQKK